MGVSTDHGIEAFRHGIDVEIFQIMNDVEAIAGEPDRAGDGKTVCPSPAIVVAAYGPYRTEGFELVEHVSPADVARMDDGFRASERSHRLRAHFIVSIGQHSDDS